MRAPTAEDEGPATSPGARGGLRAAVLLCAVLPSLGTLRAPWVSDDAVILGHVHRASALADWVQPQYGLLTIRFWRPLVTLSWWVQERLFSVDPLPFRLLNLGCHALAALLVAELVLALGGGAAGALVAGLACGLFPEQGGTVTWVAGRVDSLTLPFFAGALLALARGRAGLAALAAFAACASKETSFALPAVGAVVALAGAGGLRGAARLVRGWLALTAACAVAFAWRGAALGDWLGGYPRPAGGPLEIALAAARALAGAAWPSLAAVGAVVALGLALCTARRSLVWAGLAWAALAAAPLFAVLAGGVLDPTNRRTLAFFDLGLALALGGALARASRSAGEGETPAAARTRFRAVLAAALLACVLRGALAWRDTHEWAAAGAVCERATLRVRAEAAASGSPADGDGESALPLLAGALPRVHRGAYALSWGVAERLRAPFPPAARRAWPAREVFPSERAPLAFPPPYRPVGSSFVPPTDGALAVRVEGEGAPALRVDERVPQSATDRSDALLLDPAGLAGCRAAELVLYTELGYQTFDWDPARTRISLSEAFACSNGRVSLADAWILSASLGARDAYLELRAVPDEPGGAVRASRWVELVWDPAVLAQVRSYVP